MLKNEQISVILAATYKLTSDFVVHTNASKYRQFNPKYISSRFGFRYHMKKWETKSSGISHFRVDLDQNNI